MKSLKLVINYKNGNTLEQDINYAHIQDGKLFFTVAKQIHAVYQEPVSVNLEIVATIDITND